MKKFVLKSLCLLIISTFLLGGCKSSGKSSDKETAPVSQEFGDESLYQTNGVWDNQYGDTIKLKELSGKIPIVSMVFTKCKYACPRIIADMRNIEKRIPEDKKDKVVFVLVSFDSENDRGPQLQSFVKEMQLDDNWLILHGNTDDVRELSMLLEVKYKKQANGDFTHSSGITLLDTKGAIAAQVDGLGKDPATLIEKVKTL